MPELTLLRVELSNTGESSEGSLGTGKGKSSAGTSLVAGGVSGGVSSKLLLSSEKNRFLKGDEVLRQIYPKTKKTSEQLANEKSMKELFGYDAPKRLDISSNKNSKVRKIMSSGKSAGLAVGGAVALASTAFTMYSNYKKAGYEMSGATHAAAMQSRTSTAVSSSISMGAAVGGALVVGGPYAAAITAAVMVAKKGYDLAQTNRRELFEIQKSQILSQVLQRNIVKTVAERRF